MTLLLDIPAVPRRCAADPRTAMPPAPAHPTAHPTTQPVAPCRREPHRWSDRDDPTLVALCRRECPRRFACAADAVAAKSPLEGIWAGIYVPPTQRGREYAMRRLESLASLAPGRGGRS